VAAVEFRGAICECAVLTLMCLVVRRLCSNFSVYLTNFRFPSADNVHKVSWAVSVEVCTLERGYGVAYELAVFQRSRFLI
jgi:hypothetical protein